MGLCTLIVGVLKYCLFWGFVRFDFYPLGLLSYGAFVHWGFSLCAHMMLIVHTWCDRDHMTGNGIVHLACWRTKILPLLGVLSSLIFIIWNFVLSCFCPLGLFSVHPRDGDSPHLYHMITWPEMRLYTLLVGVLKYCLFWGFCPLWFLSCGAFVLSCFCPLVLFSVRKRDVDCPHLLWSWSHDHKCDCTPCLFPY